MKANQIVRAVMEEQDVGTSQMANRIGKSAAVVCGRLAQENISIEKLNEMLRVLDYKLVAMPRKNRLSEGEYEVE